ncbi:MAG: hypothetical protein PHN18_10460 [Sulfurospirillaceae bacterium]|nr:hypothetical protein [Sulfurospirillaceae bacterium]MDD2827438.1 hypothetical protein [Sulfurospirillaceae bacterium]
MEIKTVVLISFFIGFIAGWGNDKAKQSYYGKGSFIENTIPPLAIIFVIYSFFQAISFGFLAILQILLGTYIGNQSNRLLKKIFKK